MNTKVLFATLAGGVAAFFLGWLLYGMLLMDTMASLSVVVEGASREPMAMWAIGVSNLLTGLLYALIFDKWAGIKSFQAGAVAGLWLGAIFTASIDLSLYSMYTMWTLPGILLDVVAGTVYNAIIAGVVGWVLGR